MITRHLTKTSKIIIEGCICPLCATKFLSGQDVVTCPDCGRVYHNECWVFMENKCPAHDSPESESPTVFKESEEELEKLKEHFANGEISFEDFDQRVKNLRITVNGAEWRLGADGEWFVLRDGNWIPVKPPEKDEEYHAPILEPLEAKPPPVASPLPQLIALIAASVGLLTAITAVLSGVAGNLVVEGSFLVAGMASIGSVLCFYLVLAKKTAGTFYIKTVDNEHVVKIAKYSRRTRGFAVIGGVFCTTILLGAFWFGLINLEEKSVQSITPTNTATPTLNPTNTSTPPTSTPIP